jgi:hypothetical protein
MIVIGGLAARGAPSVVAAAAPAGAAGVGTLAVDEVPTYVLPGRCERVRNWV